MAVVEVAGVTVETAIGKRDEPKVNILLRFIVRRTSGELTKEENLGTT